MTKPYLLPILLSLSYSGGILAQDSNHESPFISSTQAGVLAISGTTGLIVPMTHAPLIQAEQLGQFQVQATQSENNCLKQWSEPELKSLQNDFFTHLANPRILKILVQTFPLTN